MESLRTMLRTHSDVSFCHIRHSANKVVDLLANVDVEGDMGLRIDTLEEFNLDEWAQQCRQVAARDYDKSQQMEHLDDHGVGNDRGHEHA